MARVTSAEVREIIEVDSSLTLTAFITVANLIVTERLSGQGVGTTTLKEVERWLSAHFVAIRDPRAKTEKLGDAMATYYGDATGSGLDATPYGQQAKTIDPTGNLGKAGKRKSKLETIDIAID